ncbi:MAG: tol-pal system protein YbgF [candidate division Zixibacteria bacterium]|nr:tol-pal system protein YbgF [candidate division Zixibacteria bacterium]
MNRKTTMAAIIILAATSTFSGCAMKRDMIALEEKVDNMTNGQHQTEAAINHIDSLLNSESGASVQFRAEIRSLVNNLVEQIQAMQANINDLQGKVNSLAQNQTSQTAIIPGNPADSAFQPDTPAIDCQNLYDESFINIRRGQYEEGIKGFRNYLKYCSSLESAPSARFWIGEAYYSLEKYREAIGEFETLIHDYSKSEKCRSAMYKMARSYEELGQKKEARATFKKLLDQYPNTLEASQAKERLKDLK